MPGRKAAVALLNEARPALSSGWEARLTGNGELAVKNPKKRGSYALLVEEAYPLLELLDGSRTLNEIAAELLHRTGRVRHRMVVDALFRLNRAGLLEPLPHDVADLLRVNTSRKRARKKGRNARDWSGSEGGGFRGVLRRVVSFGLYLPFEYSQPARIDPQSRAARWIFAVVLGAYLVLTFLLSFRLATSEEALLSPDPLSALVLMLGGIVAALSFREVVRGVMLVGLGRTLLGAGIHFSLGIPHLAVDSRDEAMLHLRERLVYRAANIASLCAVAAAMSTVWLLGDLREALHVAVGMHLVVLFDLSPLWRGDFCALLEELLGSRTLKRKSLRFLLKRLWRNVFTRGEVHREELAMIIFSSVTILYLFGTAFIMTLLAPETVDALAAALFDSEASTLRILVGLALSLYLWLAMVLSLLAVVASVISALSQLLAPPQPKRGPEKVQPVESLELDDLATQLAAIPPFSRFPRELVREFLAHGKIEAWPPGAPIVRQGDPGDTCYVIRSGECRVMQRDPTGYEVRVATLHPGSLFGEVALLFSAPRNASVFAVTPVELIAIDRDSFLSLVHEGGWEPEKIIEQLRVHLFLQQVDLLAGLDPGGMAKLLNQTVLIRGIPGQNVITAGEQGKSMYIIYSGSVEVLTAGGERVAVLRSGDYFGEIALLTGSTRSATVRCLEESLFVEIPATAYQEVLVKEFSTGLILDREAEYRLEGLAVS